MAARSSTSTLIRSMSYPCSRLARSSAAYSAPSSSRT